MTLSRLKISGFLSLALACATFAAPSRAEVGRPIIVAASGNDACMGRTPPSDTIVARQVWGVRAGLAADLGLSPDEIPWVASCFRQGNLVLQASHPVSSRSLDGQVGEVASMLATAPFIVVIGHSWGGHQVVETVVDLRERLDALSTRSGYEHLGRASIFLVTLDAIDYRYCRPPHLGNIGNPDCLMLPRSFRENGGYLIEAALASVDAWLNIYQTDARFLRSGPILELDSLGYGFENRRLTYRPLQMPHLAIMTDSRVWSTVRAAASDFARQQL